MYSIHMYLLLDEKNNECSCSLVNSDRSHSRIIVFDCKLCVYI